jgi:hypothetical protein
MNGPKRQLYGAALVGRRLGITIFWCLATFVLVASVRSVIIELYAKPAGTGDDLRCAAELRSLHDSLLEQSSAELRRAAGEGGGGDLARTQRWLRSWDIRFASTRDTCAGLWETRDTLQTLRRKLEAMLRDYAREQRPLTERIERALSRDVTRSILPRES